MTHVASNSLKLEVQLDWVLAPKLSHFLLLLVHFAVIIRVRQGRSSASSVRSLHHQTFSISSKPAEIHEWTKTDYAQDPNLVRFAQPKDINSHQFYPCDLWAQLG